jgi:hypothetical protein
MMLLLGKAGFERFRMATNFNERTDDNTQPTIWSSRDESIHRRKSMVKIQKTLAVLLCGILIAAVAHAHTDPILQRMLPQAESGNAQSQYYVGARYFQMGDRKDAELWLRKAAAQGNQPAAQFLKYEFGAASSTPSYPGPGRMTQPPMQPMMRPGGGGLCPGSGEDVESKGILDLMTKSLRAILPVPNATISLVMLNSFGVCEVQLFSPSTHMLYTVALAPTGARLMARIPAAYVAVLPHAVIDLPGAIAAAQRQGLQLPLKSALLRVAHPRGRAAIAFWSLEPQRPSGGRIENYLVAANDPGRLLTASDVSDVENDYNAQWSRIVNEFQSAQQAGEPAPARIGTPNIMDNTVEWWHFTHPHTSMDTGEYTDAP